MKLFNLVFITLALTVLSIANSHANEVVVERGTFVLNLWAPGEEAPADAKYAEWGDAYQYQYNPETVSFDRYESKKMVTFKFNESLNERYQFRWVTASEPSTVTVQKFKSDKIKIAVDAFASDQYFEVWVYDTVTGKQFMCDPRVIVGGDTNN